MMSPEELDDWLGHQGAPTDTATSTGDTSRRPQGSLTEKSDEDAWADGESLLDLFQA